MAAQTKIPPPAFDQEALAIFLACGSDETVKKRLPLLERWNEKEPAVQAAYRLRAKRLMKAWRTT